MIGLAWRIPAGTALRDASTVLRRCSTVPTLLENTIHPSTRIGALLGEKGRSDLFCVQVREASGKREEANGRKPKATGKQKRNIKKVHSCLFPFSSIPSP